MLEPRAKALAVVPSDAREVAIERLNRQRTREAERSGRKREVRARTVSVKSITKRDLELGRRLFPEDAHDERPRTRAECDDAPRPCPFVSCRYHLFLEVSPRTGSIKLNFPDLEVWEMGASCALDVAEDGGATLENVGTLMNVTRERVRQLETHAFALLLALRSKELTEHAGDGARTPARVHSQEPR